MITRSKQMAAGEVKLESERVSDHPSQQQ